MIKKNRKISSNSCPNFPNKQNLLCLNLGSILLNTYTIIALNRVLLCPSLTKAQTYSIYIIIAVEEKIPANEYIHMYMLAYKICLLIFFANATFRSL